MTILQQPDSLSLSGNLKDFRIGATQKISFILRQGADNILEQSYEPGQDGIVTISLKDVIHSRLSFLLQETSEVYLQTDIVSTFTAVIDGTEINFRVIRAGIDRFADTATNFLTQNFLTWQPTAKPVTYSTPEYLTYYAVVNSSVMLKAYFTDGSGTVVSNKVLPLAELTAGNAYTIPLQYAVIAAKLDNQLPAYYDVWVENTVFERLTYIQRYYASDMFSEQEQWILFENSLGGIDTFRAYGDCDFTADHTHNIADIDETSIEYRVDTERKFQKNTGHLNNIERTWLLDFFPSLCKYIYTGTSLRRIVVVESNVTNTDRELPSNYDFTYKYSDARPFLNLPRTDQPQEILDIVVPDLGSFSVPPRLVEFPRLPLTEGALFPVQSPYSEDWNTTTAGSISDFIADRISKGYEGGGGIGHQHNNISLLQLLTYVDDYLLVGGQKIKAADVDLDKCLRKDSPDQTEHLLQLLGGLKVEKGLITDSLRIGDGLIKWSPEYNSFLISKYDGTAANLAALGAVAAKGLSSGSGSGGVGGATALYQLIDVVPNDDSSGVKDAIVGSVLKYNGEKWIAGEGLDTVELKKYLDEKQYAKLSDIPSLAGYATETWVIEALKGFATNSNMETALSKKVDKIEGMGLSQNSFTNLLLDKLNGIAEGANKYVLPVAKAAILGGVMIGSTLSANATGLLNLKSEIVNTGTYSKVTVDTYGRVTKGETLLESDIPTLDVDKIKNLQLSLDEKLDKSYFDEIFERINVGTEAVPVYSVKVKCSLFTDFALSAKGMSSGSGGSGGGIDETLLWQILSNTGTEQISSTHLSTALSGYALKDNVPTKIGSGATGTWNINITGTAGSVSFNNITSKPTTIEGYGILNAMKQNKRVVTDCNSAAFLNSGTYGFENQPINAPENMNFATLISANNLDVGLQIIGGHVNNKLYFRGYSRNGSTFSTWNEVLSSVNYTDYTVQKNGTGATGKWDINITGSSFATGSMTINQRDLLTTTSGNWGGFLQDNSDGPNAGVWNNRIKILHGNTNGFYTELAQQFSGEEALYHRSMRDGTLSRWIRVLDDNNYTNYVVPKSGGTFTGNITASKSIISSNSKINDIYDATFDSNNSELQRYIVIELPVGFISSMNIYEIYIYEYSSNAASKLTIGGYNYSGNNSWINSGVIRQGSFNGSIQLGYNSTTSKCCIILGGWDYVWVYPKVFLKTVLTGYGNLDKYTTGYRIYNDTDIDKYTNKVLLNNSNGFFRGITASGNIVPATTNTVSVGLDNLRFDNIYARYGDFTGRVRTSNVFSAGESIDDSYGFVNVCRPASINNASCFSWVREGIQAFGLGFDNANRIILGSASSNKTINRWFTIGSSSVIAKGYAIDGLNDNYVVLGGGGSISKSLSAVGNTIVQRNEGGDIFARYISCDSTNSEQGTTAQFLTLNGSDNWVRKSSAKQVNSYLNIWQNYQDVIDLTASKYDQNKWYPCSVNIGQGRLITLNIWNSLGDVSHPSWATHSGGFTLNLKWTVVGSGWGTTAIQRTIHNSYYNFITDNHNPCGGIEQNTMASTEIVYLRGGAKYSYNVSNGATFVVNDNGYTWTNPNGNYSAPVISAPKANPITCYSQSLFAAESIYSHNLEVGNDAVIRRVLTVNGAATFTNTLTANSSVQIKDSLLINKTLDVYGTTNIFAPVVIGDELEVGRALNAVGGINVYDNFYSFYEGENTFEGSLTVGAYYATSILQRKPIFIVGGGANLERLMFDNSTIQIGTEYNSPDGLRPLLINPFGGQLELGNTTTRAGYPTVLIHANSDIPNYISQAPYFAVGQKSSNKCLTFWYDGIQAQSSTSAATLYLNYAGGDVRIGPSGSNAALFVPKTLRIGENTTDADIVMGVDMYCISVDYANSAFKIHSRQGDLVNLILTGSIAANGSVAAKSVSDERLKTNFIRNIRYDEKLLLLGNVLDYNYNAMALERGIGGVDRQRHTGLIYQDVKDVLPQMVSVSDDGYGALNYISSDFICLIAGATQLNTIGLKDVLRRTKTVEEEVKELKEENMQLKQKITYLEGRFV